MTAIPTKAPKPTLAQRMRHLAKQYWKYRTLMLLLIPSLAMLVIFKYVPMYGVTIAFKNFKLRQGILGSPWVGFDVFEKVFSMPVFWTAFQNTAILGVMNLIVGFPLPILFALLLNSVRAKTWRGWIENVTYMPHFISTVVLVGMLKRVFDVNTGLISNVYSLLGGGRLPFDMFIGDTNFRTLYIWSGVWQGTGWGSIIYMAALSAVDPQLHEAATVDGATRWQRLVHIDLPAIVPTITITLILRFGSIMGIGFDKAFLMQNDTNLAASEVISTYVYKVGLTATSNMNYSYSTAIGIFKSVVSIILLFGTNALAKKVRGETIV